MTTIHNDTTISDRSRKNKLLFVGSQISVLDLAQLIYIRLPEKLNYKCGYIYFYVCTSSLMVLSLMTKNLLSIQP